MLKAAMTNIQAALYNNGKAVPAKRQKELIAAKKSLEYWGPVIESGNGHSKDKDIMTAIKTARDLVTG